MKATVSSQGGYTQLSLQGRFDCTSSREFRTAMFESLQGPGSEIWIDFSKTDYIDSSALGMLLMAKDMSRTSAKTVKLTQTTGIVKKALEFARFKDMFVIE